MRLISTLILLFSSILVYSQNEYLTGGWILTSFELHTEYGKTKYNSKQIRDRQISWFISLDKDGSLTQESNLATDSLQTTKGSWKIEDESLIFNTTVEGRKYAINYGYVIRKDKLTLFRKFENDPNSMQASFERLTRKNFP